LRVTIITEDSGVKLPAIDRYHGTIGKGVKLSQHTQLNQVLQENKLNIPSDDIEQESVYRTVLKDFIRPAKLMFAGMFSEVRLFYEELKKRYNDVELLIISGRYGIVNGEEENIPYDFHLESYELIRELDDRTNFFDELIKKIRSSDYIIISLGKELVLYLLDKGFLDVVGSHPQLIFVTSSMFKDKIIEAGHIFLQKTGVARIREENKRRIMAILEGESVG